MLAAAAPDARFRGRRNRHVARGRPDAHDEVLLRAAAADGHRTGAVDHRRRRRVGRSLRLLRGRDSNSQHSVNSRHALPIELPRNERPRIAERARRPMISAMGPRARVHARSSTRARASSFGSTGPAPPGTACGTASAGLPSRPTSATLRRVEVETLVEVDATPAAVTRRSRRTDAANAQKNAIICGIAVRELHASSRPSHPSPAYSATPAARKASSDRTPIRSSPPLVHRLDLGELGQVKGARVPERSGRWRGLGSKTTSRTQSETDELATPSSLGDLGQRPRLGRAARAPVPARRPCPGSPWVAVVDEHMFVYCRRSSRSTAASDAIGRAAMKFRIGLVLGFGLGYYLGARAGRARYEQMRRRLERLRDSRLFERMQAAVELGVERLRPEDAADSNLRLVEPVSRRSRTARFDSATAARPLRGSRAGGSTASGGAASPASSTRSGGSVPASP